MPCARCSAARAAIGKAAGAALRGDVRALKSHTLTVVDELKAKAAESDRIRQITRKR